MRRRRFATGTLVVALALGVTTLGPVATTEAKQPKAVTDKSSADRALGNGLGRLVAQSGRVNKRSSGFQINQDALTIRDSAGRVMVDLTPQANVDRAAFRRQAAAAGLVVKAVDAKHGTLEGFVPVDAVRALAALPGTGTLAQALKPKTEIGDATSQGVAFQRIDRVQAKGVDGKGITIGAMSDSYDTATSAYGIPITIHAKDDVASGDLPGTGNAKYPTPIAVVQDYPDATDEGRAMLQIAHDVAPAAKLCFATAFTGTVGFAENVRKLADKSGPCGADVIVDDVTSLDEPMFSDSVLSDAIDDVAAQGVHYFSSAGNAGSRQAWASPARLIPAATGIKGTNLDFSQVDPALYTGGLQDMNTGPGTDVAQTLNLGEAGGAIDFQWDDPVDMDGATYGAPYFQATGDITAETPAPSFSFTPSPAQVGKTVEFRTDAIPSGTTDLILSVDAPDGTNLGTIDTGSSPEVLATTLTQAGTYKITITGFDGDTGDFTVGVRPILAPSKVTTDYNVLLFDLAGHYLGALSDANTLSGRPSEIGGFAGLPAVQIVISRAGTGPVGAKRLRTVLFNDAYFAQYSDPLAPSVFGHHAAKGATAVAAYDPFKPYLPEFFTSAGGVLPTVFDSAGNRYAKVQYRRVPQIASTDGGNTTFFLQDTSLDPDTQPNFFGTSAAAPHAASIAALALQQAGGPGSISPSGLRNRLEHSTFRHDLNPNYSVGHAGKLTVKANGVQGSEAEPVPGAMTDKRFFTLSYTGKVALRSVKFYGETASPTAQGKGSKSDGIVFDPRPFDGVAPYRTDGFPFTIGATSGGLSASKVSASFTSPGGSYAGQYRHMTVSFSKGLKRGQSLKFGVDRDLAINSSGLSNEGNGADELGGATFIPSGVAHPTGMKFVATRVDGKKIRGVMVNRLGYGFTPVDGYGLVNAEQAVFRGTGGGS
jgi:hypothetical protein